MADAWRFNPAFDAGLKEPGSGLQMTWINVDDSLGSMRIVHDCTCTVQEAVRRTRLAAAAPELRDILEEALQAHTQLKGDATNPLWVAKASAAIAALHAEQEVALG